MHSRSLVRRPLTTSVIASIILSVALVVGVSAVVGVRFADAAPGASIPAPPAGSLKLAPPALITPKAHVAGAYVHVANCEQALIGANGDNDIANWINSHTPYGITSWAWSTPIMRSSNTDVSVPVNLYNGRGYWGALLGECWGDDSSITDKVWGP